MNEIDRANELLSKIKQGEPLTDEDTSFLNLIFSVYADNIYSARFRIDGQGTFAVKEEDRILVREIIRHFTERFKKEGLKEETGAFKPVISMLKKISVDFQDVSYEEVTLLSGDPIDAPDAPSVATD